jgi:fatty acid synthase subunit alpha
VRAISAGDKGKGDVGLYDTHSARYEERWSEKWAPGWVRTRSVIYHLQSSFANISRSDSVIHVPPPQEGSHHGRWLDARDRKGFVSTILDAGYHVELASGGHYDSSVLQAELPPWRWYHTEVPLLQSALVRLPIPSLTTNASGQSTHRRVLRCGRTTLP